MQIEREAFDMKKNYYPIEISVIALDETDILTASGLSIQLGFSGESGAAQSYDFGTYF